MDTTEILRDYIVQERLLGRIPAGFDDNFDLLDAGILDSLAMTNLVVFIEEKFQVHIEDHELVPANFESVVTITSLVKSKLKKLSSKDES